MSRVPETRVHVRWMIRRDMPEVLSIENGCFEYPWREDDFIRCLRQRNNIGMVAEDYEGGGLLGYMVYELHPRYVHILNLAVDRMSWRQNVGHQLVEKLKGKLNVNRRHTLSLEVRETNLAAQLFFKSQGFRATAIFRNFYDDTTEDSYHMRYSINEQPLFLGVNRLLGQTSDCSIS